MVDEAGASDAGRGDASFETLQRELRSSRDALRLVLAAGRMGTWSWDRASDVLDWDEQLHDLFGVDRAPPTFAAWLQGMSPEDRASTEQIVQQAIRNKGGYRMLRPVRRAGVVVRWIETRADVVVEGGEVVGLRGVSIDVTERESERLRAEALAASAELLARAGAELATTLEPEGVLRRATELAVPALGDACEIATLEPGGAIRRRLHVVGVDAERIARRERRTIGVDDDHPVADVIRTGRPRRLDRDDPEDAVQLGPPDDDTTAASLGAQQVVILPMVVRGEIIGALSIARARSSVPLDDEAVRVASELASRTALCFENARLYSQQRRISETLQHSLLPPGLPAIDWLDLAARYWVPESGVEVGGDFYDVVVRGDVAVAFIGDVCGKGVDAAALTAMARHTLRTALNHVDDVTAAVEWLHHAVLAQMPDSFITLVVLRFEREGGVVRGESLNAGHPRAVVVRAGGATEVLAVAGTPVGIALREVAPIERFVLQPGDAVVAYTDGITDIAGEGALIDADVSRMLGACADLDAEAMAVAFGHELDERLPRAVRTDDIALLVARHPDA